MQVTYLFEVFWFITLILSFIHFSKQTSWKDACVFFIPALIWGYSLEFFGIIIYKMYFYPTQNYILVLFNVPLTIAAGWATMLYLGYYLTTKLLHAKKNIKMDIETALISTSFDIILLEPLAFIYKLWIWTQNNLWFGAPLLNFIGWFFGISIFMATYGFTTNKVKDKNKQLTLMLILLIPAKIFLHLIGITYFLFFSTF
ncbi:MAG: hypothetical protein COT90_04255 [Candidatus Diapherotrites archaeon CG10_big_fil_rev_8_21_14_0_10_31_34]|nr:MAG: hypothetical protein COT90_04255 [Candidatus Diapherotrites archaeon CG10_big_fil_rev_8_21_14_0_10_31_34]